MTTPWLAWYPMIKVNRTSVHTPEHLAGEASPGHAETQANLAAIAEGQKPKFAAYKHGSVKSTLNALFGRKCAYCESLTLGTQPGDVEHYRPKAKVAVVDERTGEITMKRGYPFLAASWDNLLPSCIDCNRPRTQPEYDGAMRVIGKSNFFPLAVEDNRAGALEELGNEEPLLLDPCVDNPHEHLEFNDDGSIEARQIDGEPSRKGLATIHYCGLARAELLQMRLRHQRGVKVLIRHIRRSLAEQRDPGDDLADLLLMLAPTEPYVALTRALVRRQLAPELTRLGVVLDQ